MVLLLVGHIAAVLGLAYGPRNYTLLVSLNALVSVGVLCYLGSRARFIFAGRDWSQVALAVFELLVLIAAAWAFRQSRFAVISSYVAFGIHFLVVIAAVIFAFTFKMTRLI